MPRHGRVPLEDPAPPRSAEGGGEGPRWGGQLHGHPSLQGVVQGAGEAAGQGRAAMGHVTEDREPEEGREDSGVTRGWAESTGRHREEKGN